MLYILLVITLKGTIFIQQDNQGRVLSSQSACLALLGEFRAMNLDHSTKMVCLPKSDVTYLPR